ncbi:MAG: NAD-dependent epimerase/dehydratase family protein [Candidatus Kapabacteria bacterium]|nr:NAD-dependent epimerase/dehydratase family protein [Candidatus Kapabacteria bacterium]
MYNSQSKTVLVSGAAGFIGSHLSANLVLNHRIIGIDDFSSGCKRNISNLLENEKFTFYHSRIQDLEILRDLISETDIVIHLAASVGVLKTYCEPLLTLENNINSSHRIIELCYELKKPLIIASSSEIYGNYVSTCMKEESKSEFDNIISKRMSYTVSKVLDEMKLFLLKDSGMQSIVLRFFNIIGPNQTGKYGMVTPKFIKQAIKNEPITIYGNGNQVRSFCDIRDVIYAIEKIIDKEDYKYNVFNLGSDNEISINDLADKILKYTNSKSQKIYIPFKEVHTEFEEVSFRKPCYDKFKESYGWNPNFSIEDSIKSIIQTNYGS